MAERILTPCNVACGSGIMRVNSPSGSSTPQCDTWLWDNMPLNSPSGSTVQCGRWLWDDMPLNSPKCPPYWNSTTVLVSISTTSPQSTCHSAVAPVSEILSKSDHPQQKKMTSCQFSRWQISAILNFRDPIMGCLKSPIT